MGLQTQQHHEVGKWEYSHSALKCCGHSASEKSPSLGRKHTDLKTVTDVPCNSVSLQRTECWMVHSLLHGSQMRRKLVLCRRQPRDGKTPPCHCARSRSSLSCPKWQLVRQKLYWVTGHRNITLCLMRFSKLPVIWKGRVHARVISLAKGILALWQGNKLSCTCVQILAVCRSEILKQIHWRFRTLLR